MDKSDPQLKKSFTLIELLIVTSIIILFSGLSLAYYNQFNEQKILETETEKLVDVLELAKKKASSGDISTPNNQPCSNFSGYKVDFSAPSSYQLLLCCSSNPPTNYCTLSSPIQNYPLPTNISIAASDNVQFKPLSGGVISEVTITIQNSAINKCRQISISSAGVIESSPCQP